MFVSSCRHVSVSSLIYIWKGEGTLRGALFLFAKRNTKVLASHRTNVFLFIWFFSVISQQCRKLQYTGLGTTYSSRDRWKHRDQQVQNSTCHADWFIAVAVSSFTRFSLDRHVFFVQNEKSFEIYLDIVHPDDRVRYISLWIICYLNGIISRLVIIIYSCCGTTSASFLIVCVQHL